MADADTLATVGQKLTDLFADTFAGGNPNISLVFLPFSAPVPVDIVQNDVVNPLRLTTFLVSNFDAPYLVSPQQSTVHGMDTSYGAASQIYSAAVMLARAAAVPGSQTESRINAEIMMARRVMDPSGPAIAMSSQPDDWVQPSNTSYWTIFDSKQSRTSFAPPPPTGGDVPPPRVFNSSLWTIKPEIAQVAPIATLEAVHEANPALARPVIADVVMNHPKIMAMNPVAASVELSAPMVRTNFMAARPIAATMETSAPAIRTNFMATRSAISVSDQVAINRSDLPTNFRSKVGVQFNPNLIAVDVPQFLHPDPPPPPPPPPPAPSSSVAIHFEYMSATIGYMAAGLPIWNGVFLADKSWYIPGMARGALLPSPNSAAPSPTVTLAYGLPTTLIIVRNVSISVKWSGQEQAILGTSGGFLGPFSVSGVSPTISNDGTWTYDRPGMQVVALLCNHLPVLPPIDAPDLASNSDPSPTPATGDAPGS